MFFQDTTHVCISVIITWNMIHFLEDVVVKIKSYGVHVQLLA